MTMNMNGRVLPIVAVFHLNYWQNSWTTDKTNKSFASSLDRIHCTRPRTLWRLGYSHGIWLYYFPEERGLPHPGQSGHRP